MKIFRLRWIILPVFLLMGLTVRANQDYGIAEYLLSAGDARSRGMGGAQTGIADNVYAGLWNPAGLAWIPGDEAQIGSQYAYLSQDRVLDLLGAAYRLDQLVLAATWVHFGVRGIIAVDASDRDLGEYGAYENAWLISAGLRIAPRWTAGATLKLLHQYLIVTQGFGYALDLGAQFTPWPDLPWQGGLAVMNIGASLHSDSGFTDRSLPFLRAGIGSRFFPEPETRLGRLAAALDLDWGPRRPILLHLGAEYRAYNTIAYDQGKRVPMNCIFARAGLDQGCLTVGAGYQPDWYSVDYAFVWDAFNTALGDFSHRLSLTIQWKPALGDGGTASRISKPGPADAFIPEPGKLHNEVVRTYYDEAWLEFQKGNLIQAKTYLLRCCELDPAQPQVEQLLKKVEVEIGGRTRDKQIQDELQEAAADYAAGEIGAAAGHWRKVLSLAPEHPEALQGLHDIQEKTARLLAQAKREADAGRWTQAQTMLETAVGADPQNMAAKELLAECRRRTAQKGVQNPERQQFDRLLQKGQELCRAGKYAEALNIGQELLSQKPDDPQAAGLAAQAEQGLASDHRQAETHYSKGLQYYQQGQLSQAETEWRETLRLNPAHEKSRKALNKILE